MANRLKENPIYFDQFNADATFAAEGASFIIQKIRYKSVADGDKLQIENFNADVIFEDIQTSAGDWREIDFGDQGFNLGNKGVRIDVSKCTGMAATDGTDALYIYLK